MRQPSPTATAHTHAIDWITDRQRASPKTAYSNDRLPDAAARIENRVLRASIWSSPIRRYVCFVRVVHCVRGKYRVWTAANGEQLIRAVLLFSLVSFFCCRCVRVCFIAVHVGIHCGTFVTLGYLRERIHTGLFCCCCLFVIAFCANIAPHSWQYLLS